jgi:probable blue pigment (indigoidine) exporter
MSRPPVAEGLLTLPQTTPAAPRPTTAVINPVLVLVACMWAASNLLTKWVLEVLEPSALVALRMGVIAVLMLVLLFIRPRRRLAPRDLTMLLVFGGGLVALQLFSFSYAMKLTTASEGSLLISTAPAWTAVMVAVLGMERVTSLNWLGIVIASGGVAMIVLGPAGRIPATAPARLAGDLVMLASAWLYAGYMVLSRRWMQRLGELQVICLTFAAAGAFLALLGAPQLVATDWGRLTAGHWLGIAHMTLTAGFLGILLWYWTIARTSASGTAVYQYLVTVLAVVGAAAFLGERLAPLQLAGIAVALVGVYLARIRPDRTVLI